MQFMMGFLSLHFKEFADLAADTSYDVTCIQRG